VAFVAKLNFPMCLSLKQQANKVVRVGWPARQHGRMGKQATNKESSNLSSILEVGPFVLASHMLSDVLVLPFCQ